MSEGEQTSLSNETMATYVVCMRVGWSEELAKALQQALKRHKGSKDTSDEVARAVWQKLGKFENVRFGSCSEWEERRVLIALRRLIGRARRLEGRLLDDPDALEAAYIQEQQKYLESRDALQARTDEARIFNRKIANADFGYWLSKSWWTLEEAVTLTYGKDPKRVAWPKLKRLLVFSPWVRAYEERLDLVTRHARGGEMTDPVRPQDFVRWALKYGLTPGLPPELTALAKDSKAKAAEGDGIHHHTLHAFYAVLLGTAVSRHGLAPDYDPDTGGSEAFASLQRDILDAGLKISVKTLRKHAKAALLWAEREEIRLKRPKPMATPR